MVRPPFQWKIDMRAFLYAAVVAALDAAAVFAGFVAAVAAVIDFADTMIPINETRTLVHSPITPSSPYDSHQ